MRIVLIDIKRTTPLVYSLFILRIIHSVAYVYQNLDHIKKR